jgi:hypothetical protein
MRAVERAGFTFSLVAGSVGFLYLTLTLAPTARQVPLFVVVPLVVLLFLQLLRDVRSARSGGYEGSVPEKTTAWPRGPHETQAGTGPAAEMEPKPRRFVLPWVLGLPALAQLLGMVAGPGLFVLLYLRVRGEAPWRVALAGSVVTVLGLWLLLSVVLETI